MARWDNYITPIEKKCSGCEQVLPIASFRVLSKPRKNGDPSYYSLCGPCEVCYFNKRACKKEKNRAVRVDSLEGEEWMAVVGFEGLYEVSSLGRIKSLFKIVEHSDGGSHGMPEALLRPRTFGVGYEGVTLVKEGINHSVLVHRIVGIAFLPNPENLPEVNHKWGIKNDNRVSELEWSTHQKNCEHRSKVLMRNNPRGAKNKLAKLIEVTFPDGRTAQIKSVRDVVEAIGMPTSTVRGALEGRNINSKGYSFKHINS